MIQYRTHLDNKNKALLILSFSIFSDDSKYLSQLEDSGWLGSVRRLLEIASAIASEIENEKSTVLVAYDDGVDRTSQVGIQIVNYIGSLQTYTVNYLAIET